MRRATGGCVAVLAVFAMVACSDSDKKQTPGKEAGANTDSKANSTDGGGSPQNDGRIIVAEGGATGDGGQAAYVCDSKLIGKACTKDGGECGDTSTGMGCLQTSDDGTGICTCDCQPDNPDSPLKNEDSCPDQADNVCGSVELTSGDTVNLCLRRCTPGFGGNSCDGAISCDPRSGLVFGLDSAVCAFPGCKTDDDCPVITATACKTDDATTCTNGQRCIATADTGTDGLCAMAGACDATSGLCNDRKDKAGTFKADAKVGDACKDDTECGSVMRCERQLDTGATMGAEGADCQADTDCCSGTCDTSKKCTAGVCTMHARNGYCYIPFCAADSLKAVYGCPAGSVCNRLYTGGLCLKACKLGAGADADAADLCRGNPNDKAGDYECHNFKNLGNGELTLADGPSCDFADTFTCAFFDFPNNNGLSCAILGDANNTTKMGCRTIDGKPTTQYDPKGFCFDDTTSGPDAAWPATN